MGEAGTQRPPQGDWEAAGVHRLRHFACDFPGGDKDFLQMSSAVSSHGPVLPMNSVRFLAILRHSMVVS